MKKARHGRLTANKPPTKESRAPALEKALSSNTALETAARDRGLWFERNAPPPNRHIGLLGGKINPDRVKEESLHRAVVRILSDIREFQPLKGRTWKDYAAFALAHDVGKNLPLLMDLADSGDAAAQVATSKICVQTAQKLKAFVSDNPGKLLAFSRSQIAWPVLISPHPHFSFQQPSQSFEHAQDDLFKRLELGQENLRTIHGGNYDASDARAQIIFQIYDLIETQRQIGERGLSIFAGLQGRCDDPFHLWQSMAARLPSLCVETSEAWWKMMDQFILWFPERIPGLKALKAPRSKQTKDGKPFPRYVRDSLREKFRSMMGMNKTRGKA